MIEDFSSSSSSSSFFLSCIDYVNIFKDLHIAFNQLASSLSSSLSLSLSRCSEDTSVSYSMRFVRPFRLLHTSHLPRYMGSADENSQEQHLSRSYSFELRPNHFPLPSVDYTPPCVRYPTSEQQQQRRAMERSQRSSSTNGLVNSAMISSQVSLPNRKVNVSRSHFE